jgi:hypothetical protein
MFGDPNIEACCIDDIILQINGFNAMLDELRSRLANVSYLINQTVETVYTDQNKVIRNIVVLKNCNGNAISSRLISEISNTNEKLGYLGHYLERIEELDNNVCINCINNNNYIGCLSKYHKCIEKYQHISMIWRIILDKKAIII